MEEISKTQMIRLMKEHGMSEHDFWDFYDTYGVKEYYRLKDVRWFLGY